MAKSTNFNFELPAQTDFYDVDVTNGNFNIVDKELKKAKDTADKGKNDIGDLNTLKTAEKRNLVGAVNEVKEGLGNVSSDASGTSYTDTTTQLGAINVQQAIEKIVEKVKALETKTQTLEQELTGQVTRLSGINTELETEIGTPTV